MPMPSTPPAIRNNPFDVTVGQFRVTRDELGNTLMWFDGERALAHPHFHCAAEALASEVSRLRHPLSRMTAFKPLVVSKRWGVMLFIRYAKTGWHTYDRSGAPITDLISLSRVGASNGPESLVMLTVFRFLFVLGFAR